MTLSTMIAVALGTLVAALSGSYWVDVMVWGAIATCLLSAVESKSIDPVMYALAPSSLLMYPDILGGFGDPVKVALTISVCAVSMWSAVESRHGEEFGLGRTDVVRPDDGAATDRPATGVAVGAESASTRTRSKH